MFLSNIELSWSGTIREAIDQRWQDLAAACGDLETHLVVGTGASEVQSHHRAAELDRPAERPAWSVLDCSKLSAVRGKPLPHYRDAIPRYLAAEERLK